MKLILPIFLALFIVDAAASQTVPLQFAPIFTDSMVLQQQSEVAVWGKGRAGKKITLDASWKKGAWTVVDSVGSWSIKIKTAGAGGPYKIQASDGDSTIVLNDVLLGEVWLCSGQSNMEMPLEGWRPNNPIMNSDSEIANAQYPVIRLFQMKRSYSSTPEYSCDGKWTGCTPQNARLFSAAGYFFGRSLYKNLNVPIGLIHASWGGTQIESWMSKQDLETIDAYVPMLKKIEMSKDSIEGLNRWIIAHPTIKLSGRTMESRWLGLDFADSACASTNFNDSLWREMSLPTYWEGTEVGNFDGAVWFRKRVAIPSSWRGKDLFLSIGPVDDMDETYVNGTLVGSHLSEGMYEVPRIYPVPAKIAGDSIVEVAVRVIDYGGGGGLWGKPEELQLNRADTTLSLSLAGEWKYLPVAEYRGSIFYTYGWRGEEFYKRPKLPFDFTGYSPTALFNGMISPVIPFGLRGAIWYQGESNVGQPEMYAKLFPTMINEWRSVFHNPEMPFYYVQIAPFNYGPKTQSQYLREAQFNTLKVKNTGMAVVLDIANPDNIHPADKQDVGGRLALWALSKTYHKKNVICSGPLYHSMKIKKNTIVLSFDYAGKKLVLKGDPAASGFQIAGEDKQFKDAAVTVKGATIVVSNPEIPHPVAVRYAFSNTPAAALLGESGLPASSFRTDSWAQ